MNLPAGTRDRITFLLNESARLVADRRGDTERAVQNLAEVLRLMLKDDGADAR